MQFLVRMELHEKYFDDSHFLIYENCMTSFFGQPESFVCFSELPTNFFFAATHGRVLQLKFSRGAAEIGQAVVDRHSEHYYIDLKKQSDHSGLSLDTSNLFLVRIVFVFVKKNHLLNFSI